MSEINELLEFSKIVVERSGLKLLNQANPNHKVYKTDLVLKKEVKAEADEFLEKEIMSALIPIGFPILTEESGYYANNNESNFLFIVDPLDGTFNFVKGSGPSAISVGLWKDNKPVFGVIYDLYKQQLIWGGMRLNSYSNGQQIRVSSVKKSSEAVIFSGFPVRFNFNDTSLEKFWKLSEKFAKVRMIGSAAISLVNVAKGFADVYLENNIMLWDVAAGLAIVEGAGGKIHFSQTKTEYSLNVIASNSELIEIVKDY